MTQKSNEILQQLKDKLIQCFGDDIKDVILFGSRATNKATEYSDYDIVIIVNRDYDWKYKNNIYDSVFDIEYQYNITIDVHLVSDYELKHSLRGAHPLFQKAIKNGIHA